MMSRPSSGAMSGPSVTGVIIQGRLLMMVGCVGQFDT